MSDSAAKPFCGQTRPDAARGRRDGYSRHGDPLGRFQGRTEKRDSKTGGKDKDGWQGRETGEMEGSCSGVGKRWGRG